MKRLMLGIICLAVCTVFCSSLGFAAENMVEWYGDYSDSQNIKLVIPICSSVKYNQRVTVAMYPANISNPTVYDFCRIAEEDVAANGEQNIVIKIGDDLQYSGSDGRHYKVKLRGSGINDGNINEILDVYILTSNDVTGTGGILASINSAHTAESVGAVIKPVVKALQIDENALNDSRIACFLTVKELDFKNNFNTLDDFNAAWNIAEVVEYLRNEGNDKERFRALTEKYADILNINIADTDYIQYADDVYSELCRVKETYQYGDAPKGICSGIILRRALEQYQAAAAVNSIVGTVSDEAENILKKYYDILEIPADSIAKFNYFSDTDKGKALRIIYAHRFNEPTEIANKYCEVVEEIYRAANQGSGNGGGGGNGGNTAVGGGSYNIPKETETATTETVGFSDCDSSHWSYPYIDELRERHIINGYEDGRFCPENNVAREEFVKMVISAVGLYSENYDCDFDDVSEHDWYYYCVSAAVKENIVKGISERYFGTGRFISREDTAVITARILERFHKGGEAEKAEFTDYDSISEYAVESVELLCGMNFLKGFEDGTFRPKAELTRAEAAKIIYLIMNIV